MTPLTRLALSLILMVALVACSPGGGGQAQPDGPAASPAPAATQAPATRDGY